MLNKCCLIILDSHNIKKIDLQTLCVGIRDKDGTLNIVPENFATF